MREGTQLTSRDIEKLLGETTFRTNVYTTSMTSELDLLEMSTHERIV